MVETNNGLQNFQGIPPNIMPVLKGFPNGIAAYQPGQNNMQFNGTKYNMSGCMGCHGVAQILGSNFSFVLLDGQKGAGIDTPSSISIPP
ncbi:MAG TPA: hypothetical protein VNA69_21745 [Thermoanaerobaculia bacterium]|nr:hypothetical protein [Thermoanaerobaculia bacterium]